MVNMKYRQAGVGNRVNVVTCFFTGISLKPVILIYGTCGIVHPGMALKELDGEHEVPSG